MILNILFLIIGMALLIKGADWFVDGVSALAKKYHISELAIGLTVVAFGTSAPELVVNSFASFQGHDSIVFGNIIGSNIFNLFLILGLTGLIVPIAVQSSTVWKEIPLSFLAIVLFYILANNVFISGANIISRFDGLLLFLLFIFFLYYIYKQLKSDASFSEDFPQQLSNFKTFNFISIGLLALVFGGQIVVNQGVALAASLGVSEKIIASTIIAAGTSLPELATSVMAAIKKKNDIAIGNIIGSNIFNLLLILSISSFIKPLHYDVKFNTDLYILAGGTLFLFTAMFIGKKKKLDRWESAFLLTGFFAYIYYLLS